jgi:hypothetical protein
VSRHLDNEANNIQLFSVEPTLLPITKMPNGSCLHNVVVNRFIAIENKENLNVSVKVMDHNRNLVEEEVVAEMNVTNKQIQVSFSKVNKGKAFYIIQLLDEGERCLFEINVHVITNHTVVQLLRKEQKGKSNI